MLRSPLISLHPFAIYQLCSVKKNVIKEKRPGTVKMYYSPFIRTSIKSDFNWESLNCNRFIFGKVPFRENEPVSEKNFLVAGNCF